MSKYYKVYLVVVIILIIGTIALILPNDKNEDDSNVTEMLYNVTEQ